MLRVRLSLVDWLISSGRQRLCKCDLCSGWTLVPSLELCKPLCALAGPCVCDIHIHMCVCVALNRNQTAMPPPPLPSTSSVTTPARDNEDLLTLCHKPADTKRIASPDPSPERSRLKRRQAGHQQEGPGIGGGQWGHFAEVGLADESSGLGEGGPK